MPSAPRVLLLCHDTIQPFTGGGATLRALFSAFPADALFSIHNDSHTIDRARIGTAHRVAPDEVHYMQPLNAARTVGRKIARARSTTAGAADTDVAASPSPGGLPIASGLRTLLDHACVIRLRPDVLSAIRAFNPDVLYGWLGDPLWGRSMVRLAAEIRVPYVIHFMDNQVGLPGGGSWTARLGAHLFRRQVDHAVAGAAGVIAISDAMADAYGRQWRRPVEVFHNVLDSKGWLPPDPREPNAVFELAFTGSIESGQLEGLLDTAHAVERLRGEGAAVRLVLYVTDDYKRRVQGDFAPFKGVEMRPHPPAEGLRAALVQADALILAYGFDPRTIEYYRYSFPTKLVPYMLSGTPILAYGPPSIAPIDYAVKGGWARTVTAKSPDALASELRDLMRSPGDRLRLGRQAHQAACREHDRSIVAPRFLEYLGAASKGAPA
jgi:glycosyltransferase involved in cell wall biosynthesis